MCARKSLLREARAYTSTRIHTRTHSNVRMCQEEKKKRKTIYYSLLEARVHTSTRIKRERKITLNSARKAGYDIRERERERERETESAVKPSLVFFLFFWPLFPPFPASEEDKKKRPKTETMKIATKKKEQSSSEREEEKRAPLLLLLLFSSFLFFSSSRHENGSRFL